jgi:hypothetical protein
MQCNSQKRKKNRKKNRTESNDLQKTMQKIVSNTNLTKTGNEQWHPEGLADPAQPVTSVKFVI